MHGLGSLWGVMSLHSEDAGENLRFGRLSPEFFVIRTALDHITSVLFISLWDLRHIQEGGSVGSLECPHSTLQSCRQQTGDHK